ncbi:hypothetical protein V6N12_052036 [Hibiscus sabdariffa]|uniref:RNase H type-1 domain-containing protein n=1 Tax=Hibiscus sabdariffa TaxID=183260 RepID=A0ABR2GI42_9ROSI
MEVMTKIFEDHLDLLSDDVELWGVFLGMQWEGMPGIVLHILDMMQRGWLVTFQYVKRDENFVVDRLVKLTFENDLSLRLYVEAPS